MDVIACMLQLDYIEHLHIYSRRSSTLENASTPEHVDHLH